MQQVSFFVILALMVSRGDVVGISTTLQVRRLNDRGSVPGTDVCPTGNRVRNWYHKLRVMMSLWSFELGV